MDSQPRTVSGVSLTQVDLYLNMLVSPCLIVCSCVGNSLAIVVLQRKSFHSLPMAVYLTFLALVDAGTVTTGLLPRFILAATDYDIRGGSERSCQLHVFIMYLFTQLSAWTLVIVTCERVLSIVRPHDIRSVCTKVKSGFFIICAVLVVGSTNIPIFFVLGKSLHVRKPHQFANVSNATLVYRTCVVKPDSGTITAIFFTLQFLKQCLLPFLIILILNIIIIVSLVRRRHALRTSLQEVTCETLDESTQVRTKSGLKKIVSRRDASLSVILVTVNAVFLVCTFPIGIYQQIVPAIPEREIDAPGEVLTYTVLVMVLYLNNTLNFLLYYVTGSKFRSEIKSLFACRQS